MKRRLPTYAYGSVLMLISLAGQRIAAFAPVIARRRVVFRGTSTVAAGAAAAAVASSLSSKTPATSFDDGDRPYAITTPIYYVNDKPHIGHAYTSTGE
jgi:hypothetical protein